MGYTVTFDADRPQRMIAINLPQNSDKIATVGVSLNLQ